LFPGLESLVGVKYEIITRSTDVNLGGN